MYEIHGCDVTQLIIIIVMLKLSLEFDKISLNLQVYSILTN